MPKVIVRVVKSTLEEQVIDLPTEGDAIRGPFSAAVLFASLSDSPVERVACAYLDARHKVLALDLEVSKGSATASIISPREILGPAVRLGACAVIVAHNHPSGDPEPSLEDRAVTERLVQAGAVVGVSVLDHLVIGDWTRNGPRYVSIMRGQAALVDVLRGSDIVRG